LQGFLFQDSVIDLLEAQALTGHHGGDIDQRIGTGDQQRVERIRDGRHHRGTTLADCSQSPAAKV
jgi:hypothetical protein